MKSTLTLLFFVLLAVSSFSQLAAPTIVNQILVDSTLGPVPVNFYSYIKAAEVSPTYGGGYSLIYDLYFSGLQQCNYYLMGFDSTGTQVAQTDFHSLHGGNDVGTNIFVNKQYVYAVGTTLLDSLNPNSTVCNIMKLDITASYDTVFTWSGSIDSAVTQSAVSVAADNTGNSYMACSVSTGTDYKIDIVKFSPTGNPVYVSSWDSAGLINIPVGIVYSSGEIIVTGFSLDTSAGSSMFSTIKFSASTGALVNLKTVANGSGMISSPVGIITNGPYTIISGTSAISPGKSIIKTVCYDSAFNQAWVAVWGDSTLSNTASSMAENAPGQGVYIIGTTTNSSGVSSMAALAYGYDGTYYGNIAVPNPDSTRSSGGTGIAVDGSSNIYLTGWAVRSNGDTSILTAAYNNNPTLLWEKMYKRNNTTNDLPQSIVMIGGSTTPLVTTSSSGAGSSEYQMIAYEQWIPTPCGDTICPTVTYNFKNSQYTTSGTDTFVEFDIYASQNEPTLGYGGGDIIFSYNSQAFGNNVVSNNDITVTRGAVTMDSNAYSISVRDTLYQSSVVPSGGGEVWISINPVNSDSVVYVADTPQQLLHVKIKRQHAGWYKISFDQFDMEGLSDYLTYDYFPYTYVAVGSPLRSDDITYQVVLDSISASYDYGFETNNDTVTFDIQAYSSAGDPLYSADAIIDFNTNVFGTFVFANNNLTCTTTTDSVYTFSVSDAYSAALQIQIQANDPGNYDLVTNPSAAIPILYTTTLATCQLIVQNCCPGQITLSVNPYSTGSYGYVDSDNTTQSSSYSVTAGSGINTYASLCNLSTPIANVSGFSPAAITAGTFDTLTINGLNFGCTQGLVQFTNANDSTGNTFTTVPPQDIVSWTGNEIKLIVASCVDSFGDGKNPGTGPIQVIDAGSNQPSQSAAPLIIPYAVMNDRLSSGRAIRVGLSGEGNEYTFTPDTTIAAHAPSLATITHAMGDWICETGVRFNIGSPVSRNLTVDSDGTNAILFGATRNPNAFAETHIWLSGPCANPSGDTVKVIQEADIIFNADYLDTSYNYYWFLGDTSILPLPTFPVAGYYSLLYIGRHEFGHCMGLYHDLNRGDVMFAVQDPNACGLIHYDDVQGGLYELEHVGGFLSPCFVPNPQYQSLSLCTGGDAGISDIGNGYAMKAYPNPFDQTVTVQANISSPGDLEIELYTMLGQVQIHEDYGMVSGSQVEETLSTAGLSAGVYLLRVTVNSSAQVFKLIKTNN